MTIYGENITHASQSAKIEHTSIRSIYRLSVELLQSGKYHLFGKNTSTEIEDQLKKNLALALIFYLFCSGITSAPMCDPYGAHSGSAWFRQRIRIAPAWEPKICLCK